MIAPISFNIFKEEVKILLCINPFIAGANKIGVPSRSILPIAAPIAVETTESAIPKTALFMVLYVAGTTRKASKGLESLRCFAC